ncbi:CPBP family intramembrane glutamic endopeptidase [Weissella soli]|uniref:CPBP family intramembrane glutamic endopeptidase n=1 Tax=Weissella soli TaxID=155866 RepID=UPI001F441CF0|nr:type II CAAX endopeptidase family protein [Weissella soli]GJM48420.1 hypothetical protein WSSLDB02_09770 [Weissella soli]
MNNITKQFDTKWFTGIILLIIGLVLDLVIQFSGQFAIVLPQKWLHVTANSPIVLSLEIGVTLLVTWLAVSLFMKLLRKENPRIGFHKLDGRRLQWSLRGYGLILLGSLLTGILQTLIMGKTITSSNQAELESLVKSGFSGAIFGILLAVFVAPILEELIFRGVVINFFFTQRNWWANILLSGVLFGYFHVVFQEFQWFAFIQYSLMGMALAIVYKKTKQIQYAMITHFINNTVATLLILGLLLFK